MVGFNHNDITETRTDKLAVVVGYYFDFSLPARVTYELIPYVGTNRNVTNKSGKPAAINTETVNFGFLNGIYKSVHLGDLQSGREFGHWFTLRPDYLLNLQDDSQLFCSMQRTPPS